MNFPKKDRRVTTPPIQLLFRFFQSRAKVQIWLLENNDMTLEGRIIGFDEYMNIVLEETKECYQKSGLKKSVGRILLKGDNITLVRNLDDLNM